MALRFDPALVNGYYELDPKQSDHLGHLEKALGGSWVKAKKREISSADHVQHKLTLAVNSLVIKVKSHGIRITQEILYIDGKPRKIVGHLMGEAEETSFYNEDQTALITLSALSNGRGKVERVRQFTDRNTFVVTIKLAKTDGTTLELKRVFVKKLPLTTIVSTPLVADAALPSPTKVVVLFYSLYSHTYTLAKAIVEGVQKVPGTEVILYQVPEVLSEEVIAKFGATQAKQSFAHVPVLTRDQQERVLTEADAVILGAPTRFGVMAAQMKLFIDGLGGLWFKNALVGKVASVFGGSASQHGGNEQNLLSMMIPLLHLGFIYVGVPYSCTAQTTMEEITGGAPYGATLIAGGDGSRAVSENEKTIATFQGEHVAKVALAQKRGNTH